MLLALTHRPSPELANCQLTFIERERIDHARALEQHAAYCHALVQAGAEVQTVNVSPQYPDSVFVEDVAIVLDEIAIITPMGSPTRASEGRRLAPVIAKYRQLAHVRPPAKLEGGDVLRVGKALFVGLSCRTDRKGLESLASIVLSYGYRLIPVVVHGCLHLKTACTALDEETLLVNPSWVETQPFKGLKQIPVPGDEPWGANVIRLPDRLCVQSRAPKTADLVRDFGHRVLELDTSEFSKAEGG